MSSFVLSTMSFDKPDAELHLRLLNTWKVGNPSRPDQFYAFGTLWVDAEGTEIEGTSHRAFADILEDQIVVGSVYELARCQLQMPSKTFRTCFYPRMLVVAPSNVVRVIGSPPPAFPLTAFEYVEFEDLPSRESPCPHLSGIFFPPVYPFISHLFCGCLFSFAFCHIVDVIGRPISISVLNHTTATSTNTIMLVQEVVLVNKMYGFLFQYFFPSKIVDSIIFGHVMDSYLFAFQRVNIPSNFVG
ncbi:hypothetical protein LINPERPRIM_LOCUS17156 [Linum perenne]